MKPRVQLVFDTYGWSFHHIAQQLKRRLSSDFEFELREYGNAAVGRPCDVLVCFWWRVLEQLDCRRAGCVVTCLYDHWTPHQDLAAFQQAMDASDILVLANERMLADLKGVRLPPFWICPDGVDLEQFPWAPVPDQFCWGWAGRADVSKTRDGDEDNKGLALLKRAAEIAKEPLLVLDSSQQLIKHERMAEAFYHRIGVYCCASESEGTPNAVLEAMACGRPVISTDVGIVPHLVHHGVNGLIVRRDLDSLVAAVREIKRLPLDRMGRAARRSAETCDWSWRMPAWRDCLLAACERAETAKG